MDTKMDVDHEAGPSTPPTRNNIIYMADPPVPSTAQQPYDYHSLDTSSDPSICIDNGESIHPAHSRATLTAGSHSWRAGFSTMSTPYIDRTNIVARYKERKIGKNILLFGRDVEADANSRSNTRLMYDGDMLIHQDMLVRRWTQTPPPLALHPPFPAE
jgi:actin-related protein 5